LPELFRPQADRIHPWRRRVPQRERHHQRRLDRVIVYYTNGDLVSRRMQVSVGSNRQTVSFPPTGSWNTVGAVKLISGGFTPGLNNTVLFSLSPGANPPDLDWIEIQ